MRLVEVVTSGPDGEEFSAHTFLQYMRRSNPVWWNPNQRSADCPWVFRGHKDANWRLVPTAGRPPEINDLSPVIEGLGRLPEQKKGGVNSDRPENTRERLLLVEAQKLVFRRFVQLGRQLAFPVGEDPYIFQLGDDHPSDRSVLQIGALPLWGRRRKFVTCDHEYQKAQIALAQHHGVPTFFLDWTQDPMVACYFASQRNRSESDIDKDLAIWALKTDTAPLVASGARSLDTLLPSLNIFRPSPDQNAYLASQSALSTYFLDAEIFFDERGYYPALEEFFELLTPLEIRSDSTQGKLLNEIGSGLQCLRKVVLRAENVPELRDLLQREGITKAHLMPTLDNVSKTAFELALNEACRL